MDSAVIEADLRRGIGRRKVTQDFVSPALVDRLAKTLECDGEPPRSGEALPAGWHTIFCLHAAARGELGEDGLPLAYELIPQVPMQRRLFGGARLEFHAPLIVGEDVTCESELSNVKLRSTPAALMAIATLRHRFSGPAGLAAVEEQDIIHLQPLGGNDKDEDRKPTGDSKVPPTPSLQRAFAPDPITLFRFSALTFNSHRIHYDAPYAEAAEKLPKLIVQGKLIALSLIEVARRALPAAVIKSFQYRSSRPLFVGVPCMLAANVDEGSQTAQLWAQDESGAVVQTASLTFNSADGR
jgi:3-methylfumaryl-CoA hydratase